jgi:hypothetical protein
MQQQLLARGQPRKWDRQPQHIDLKWTVPREAAKARATGACSASCRWDQSESVPLTAHGVSGVGARAWWAGLAVGHA